MVNHPPVVVPNGITDVTTGKGAVLAVPVLGRLPAAYGFRGPAPALIADPEGDTLTVDVVAPPPPALGSVAVDPATGAVTFTPTAKYANGKTSFVVRAREAGSQGLLSGNVTISVTVGARAARERACRERCGQRAAHCGDLRWARSRHGAKPVCTGSIAHNHSQPSL